MCGINGIISRQNIDGRNLLVKMNQSIQHRGPDANGVHHDDHVGLGHQRLKIIDLSEAGDQPMISADGRYAMVFNGEVYNFEELRKELDYPFKSKTDSEVILAAWIKWGPECVKRFNGMFAFAIWDKMEKKVWLLRDRLGIKPLYWHFNGEILVFSSELRALLASGIPSKSISYESLVDYLRYQTVQAPDTILEDVKMLSAGSMLSYDFKSAQPGIVPYWTPVPKKEAEVCSYDEVKTEVRRLFLESVERRLVADVPFGAFLSGGIDSSAIVGAMSKVSNNKIKTFNISFAEEEFSEARYARHIAQKHQTDHCEIKLSPNDFLNYLPEALNSMDHPSGDGPNTWLVSKVTREAGITMALSGLGGDELFGGYAVFNRMLSLDKKKDLWKLPLAARKGIGKVLSAVKPGVASSKMAAILSMPSYQFNTAYSFSRQALMDQQVAGLVSNGVLPEHKPLQHINAFSYAEANNLLTKVSVNELTTYMQNVLLRDSDQMSMAHALEVRVPFLDHELLEYVLSLPDKYKYPLTPKKLLVDSLPDLLPDFIVNRPKMGFTFPWKEWLKNELFIFADDRIRSLAKRDFFNEAALIKLWKDFNADDPNVSFSRIWPLIVLEEWMENIDL